MKKIKYFLAGFLLISYSISFAQVNVSKSVQVGNTTANAMNSSAAIQIDDTARGFLGARMTTVQRTAIASPATGLQVYDTNTNSLWLYNGTVWVDGASSASAWAKSGNSGTNSATDFIGTIDSTDVHFRTKNISRMKIDAAGNVGIGITATTPLDSSYKLDVKGTLNSKMVQIHNDPPTSTDIFLQSGTWEGCYISTLNSGMTIKNNCNFGNMSFQLNGYAPGGFSFTGSNVGIGTTSPTQALDVTGNMKFSGALMPNNTAGTAGQILTSAGAGAAPTWTSLPASSATLYGSDGSLSGNRTVSQGTNTLAFTSSATTGTSQFTVDGTTLNVDTVNNRIGIGKAAPAYTLDVVGTVNATSNITSSGYIAASGDVSTTGLFRGTSGMFFSNPGGQGFALRDGTWAGANITYSANSLSFSQNDNNGQMNFILGGSVGTKSFNFTGGNLGIGTSSASQALDVAGNVKFSGALMPNNTAGTAGQVLTSAGAGAVPTWTTLPTTNLYTSNGSLSGNRIVTQGANTLAFTSTATNGFSVDGSTFSVDALNHRIGIGTATPAAALDVAGTAKFNGGATISSFLGGTWIDMPTTGASAIGSGGAGVNPWVAYVGGTGYYFLNSNTGDIAYRNTGGRLLFGNTSTNASMALSGDKLGIGTVTPTSTLQTNGTFALNTATSGTSNSVVLLSTGTFTPPTANTVSGRIYIIRNTSAATNVSVTSVIDYSATTAATFNLTPAIGSVMIISDGTNWYRIQ